MELFKLYNYSDVLSKVNTDRPVKQGILIYYIKIFEKGISNIHNL